MTVTKKGTGSSPVDGVQIVEARLQQGIISQLKATIDEIKRQSDLGDIDSRSPGVKDHSSSPKTDTPSSSPVVDAERLKEN